MASEFIAQTSRLIDRLLAALAGARRERAILWVLAAYWVLWSIYGAISKASQDIHFDMGEAVVWAHESLAGNPKHPPLSAWIVRGWFSIFPQADWAYYTLSILLAVIGLFAAWKVSARFLTGEKRVAALALLMLVPFFNFHALKYNANSVMIPLWALCTWAFIVSFETRWPLPAALAGLAAAAAMLGKYWSIILLVSLGIAALIHPGRRQYFRSPAPYVTIAVGALALAPHLVWMIQNSTTLAYAMESHPGTVWTALYSGATYIAGALGYMLPAAIVAWLGTRPSRAALTDLAWPRNEDRRLAVIVLVLPLLLPAIAAVVATENIVPLWSIGGATLLGVVLLSSPLVTLSHVMARRVVGTAIAFCVLSLLASPLVAWTVHRRGLENHAGHYRLVAQAVEQEWRKATDKPLRIFGSYDNLLYGAAFYLTTPPKTFEIVSPARTPWTSEADATRDGIAMVCPFANAGCINALNARVAKAPAAKRVEVDLVRRYLGVPGKAERFVIAIVPPPK
jgi:4-amino-4-deoxy-L-arabinose transferase-like glycosyltransferase